jgi:hypothetical protein
MLMMMGKRNPAVFPEPVWALRVGILGWVMTWCGKTIHEKSKKKREKMSTE